MEDIETELQPENLPDQNASEPSGWAKPANPDKIWNTLSLVALVGLALVVVAAFMIYQNPYSAINPFPPETPIAPVVIPSQTPTPTLVPRLPGTWTPTATLTPTITLTGSPTITGTPQPPTPTLPNTAYHYLQRGSVTYLSGNIMHPDETCKLWVAGQAYDMKGSPVIGITVEIGGMLNYKNVYLLSLTGTALQYGPGGYEFVLADKPINSKGAVWVQLLNQEQIPLSERVTFDTTDACDKNLILINFKQVR